MTQTVPSITIAIPTFNRKSAILDCLSNLVNSALPSNVYILVIDNNSQDGTFDVIKKFNQNEKIRILQNSSNIGFSGNTAELIRQCDTEYVIWNSDEDDVLVQNIGALASFLAKNSPVFVAPQYHVSSESEDYLYRGKVKSEIINPKYIWSFTHLPGLVFRVDIAQKALVDYDYWNKKFPIATNFYPQIMLIAYTLTRGNGYWWNMPINKERITLEETHVVVNNIRYYDLPSRWDQYKDFADYFVYMEQLSENKYCKDIIKTYIKSHNMWFISVIRSSIDSERPNQLSNFDSALKLNCLTSVGFMRKLFYSIFVDQTIIYNKLKSKIKYEKY